MVSESHGLDTLLVRAGHAVWKRLRDGFSLVHRSISPPCGTTWSVKPPADRAPRSLPWSWDTLKPGTPFILGHPRSWDTLDRGTPSILRRPQTWDTLDPGTPLILRHLPASMLQKKDQDESATWWKQDTTQNHFRVALRTVKDRAWVLFTHSTKLKLNSLYQERSFGFPSERTEEFNTWNSAKGWKILKLECLH